MGCGWDQHQGTLGKQDLVLAQPSVPLQSVSWDPTDCLNSGGDGAGRRPAAHSHAGCPQSGSELSSRLDVLSAERDELSGVVRQREADLLAAQSLAREKEEVLSQERQRGSRERDELQGRLADKVGRGGGAPSPCDGCVGTGALLSTELAALLRQEPPRR